MQEYKSPLDKLKDRRRFQRVKVNILGRFMLDDGREFPCQVLNMSPGGLSLTSPIEVQSGEHVIFYLQHLGRIEGKVTRSYRDGFSVAIDATDHKRDKLAEQLTWLINQDLLNVSEARKHERSAPAQSTVSLRTADGHQYGCHVIDMSISGAAIRADIRPDIGDKIIVGKMLSKVVRYLPEGFAVEFISDLESHQTMHEGTWHSGYPAA